MIDCKADYLNIEMPTFEKNGFDEDDQNHYPAFIRFYSGEF